MAQDEVEVFNEQPEAASGEQQDELDATPDNIEYAGEDEPAVGGEID